jgi:hypothetical protein
MKRSESLKVTTLIEHKQEGLPRFVCIPLDEVAPWKLDATTTVEGTINRRRRRPAESQALGRSSLLVYGSE